MKKNAEPSGSRRHTIAWTSRGPPAGGSKRSRAGMPSSNTGSSRRTLTPRGLRSMVSRSRRWLPDSTVTGQHTLARGCRRRSASRSRISRAPVDVSNRPQSLIRDVRPQPFFFVSPGVCGAALGAADPFVSQCPRSNPRWLMTTPATPSPAATLVLVRDRPSSGVEVLLIQRHSKSKFAAGDYVFAGGKVVADDVPSDVEAFCHRLSADDATARLGGSLAPREALGYWVGAIREAFEEVGVLLAYGPA